MTEKWQKHFKKVQYCKKYFDILRQNATEWQKI